MFAQVPSHFAQVKTVLVSSLTVSGVLPEVYMIMRATRPLVGLNQTETQGAFYAIIDLNSKNAFQHIETNISLDASIVMVADDETQQFMSVVGTSHFNKFLEMTPANRKKATTALVNKLKGLPYQTLAHKQLEALEAIVKHGEPEATQEEKALKALFELIENGRDFADACFKASQDFHVDYDELSAAYDEACQ